MERNLVIIQWTLKTDGHVRNPQHIEELIHKSPDFLLLKWDIFVYKNEYNSNNLEGFSYWLDELASNAASYASVAIQCTYCNKSGHTYNS